MDTLDDDDPEYTENPASLTRGAGVIRALLATLPDTPGVYRMLNERGDALYVGKAKALKKRVTSYTAVSRLPRRLQRMVAETHEMMFVRTHTEVEALLLESNLIKKLKPRYNVLLRDDKSFPYIHLTGDHDFPLLVKHRGAQKRKGDYFGPFASAGAVNNAILTLQKAFMIRNCSDSVFENRKRPCLQYHIKRCTAPCVGLISKEDYARQVADARAFLSGKSRQVQERLAKEMQTLSAEQQYEAAAAVRDRIRALTAIQTKQDVNVDTLGDADVIGLYRDGPHSCVQVFFFRAGQNFGNRSYFPRHAIDDESPAILAAFIAQFYEGKPIPPDIIISEETQDRALLEEAFCTRDGAARKIFISVPQRGARKRLTDFAVRNAKDALARERIRRAGDAALTEELANLFGMEKPPERIEVYDNSHISGTNMTGVMIVAGAEGFLKNAYRKFNIREADAADDYGMMREVMSRRFGRALKEGGGPGTPGWPDLVLIDGGLGQLNAVMKILEDLGIAEDLAVVSIAKGPDRNAGRETFFMPGRPDFQLAEKSAALHYLQRLRDEAHRFAIGAHRTRRAKQTGASPLDGVPGIGAKRKKALLMHFGSGQDVAKAGLADLLAVPGISKAVAEKIYNYFHEDG